MGEQNEKIEIKKIVELLKKSKYNETFYDSMYNLYVLLGIAKGVNEMNQGKGIPLEELLKEMEELYENSSRRFG